ncbi:MAG: hypothetical protein ACOX0C_03055 [Patescibacteria group bacterium]|jgi:hypothetical protein
MFKQNSLLYLGKIIASLFLEVIYFPIWWYSVGLFRVAKKVWRFLRNREKSLGFSVWLKNIFVPMYGQSDFWGKLISFVIRSVQVVARGLILIVWGILSLGLIIIWLALPILLGLAILLQFIKIN